MQVEVASLRWSPAAEILEAIEDRDVGPPEQTVDADHAQMLLKSYKRMQESEAWKDTTKRLKSAESRLEKDSFDNPGQAGYNMKAIKYLRFFRMIPEFAIRRLEMLQVEWNRQEEWKDRAKR